MAGIMDWLNPISMVTDFVGGLFTGQAQAKQADVAGQDIYSNLDYSRKLRGLQTGEREQKFQQGEIGFGKKKKDLKSSLSMRGLLDSSIAGNEAKDINQEQSWFESSMGRERESSVLQQQQELTSAESAVQQQEESIPFWTGYGGERQNLQSIRNKIRGLPTI